MNQMIAEGSFPYATQNNGGAQANTWFSITSIQASVGSLYCKYLSVC